MQQLRKDLILVPAQAGEQFQVQEPKSGAVFEFGEQEAFLIEALRRPYDAAELMAAYNARFGLSDGPDDLQEFLAILKEWGLLEARAEGPGLGPSRRSPAKRLSLVPATDVTGHPEATAAVTDVASVPEGTPEGAAGQDESDVQRDNRWHLFKPEGLFDVLDRALSPFRFLVWLIPLVVVYSIAAVWFNRHLVVDAVATAKLHFGLIGRLIFAGLAVNLVLQLSRGVVARHFGLRVPSFGMVMAFGVIPRFNVQVVLAPEMPKADRLWFFSTSLLARLVLVGAGITLWLTTMPSGSLLSVVGAELAVISAMTFLFVANPLWAADGYHLFSILAGVPNLRQRAKIALRDLLLGRPRVIARYAKHSWALACYAVASVAFTVALVGFLAFGIARRLESDHQGAGVALFLVIVTYLVHNRLLRARSRKEADQRRVVARQSQRQAVPGNPLTLAQQAGARVPAPELTRSQRGEPAKRNKLGYVVLFALVGILFLPYSYETGGNAKIFPVAQHEMYAEMDGVIEDVYYQGGEWVAQGTVVGQMAQHRQQKDVKATWAAIEAKARDIDRLRSTPSRESIQLAEEELETARLELSYSVEEAGRNEKLFAKGTVSLQALEDAKKKRDVDRQQVVEKRAGLEALRAQVNPNEIASAEAELQKLQEELAFYEEELRRTSLRMPISGRITTTKLMDLRNKYLKEGQLFAEVEDIHEVRVEVDVPESDILQVDVGDPVRLKTWADSSRIFTGTVKVIAPKATDESYGEVVKVIATLPNPDLALKTGMTGYAKIRGEDTLVVVAFTKALVRFFTIEVWSWLP